MPMKECKYCGVSFEEKRGLPAHERRCKMNPNKVVATPAVALTKEQIRTIVDEWGKKTIAEFSEDLGVPERSINKTVKEIRKASNGKYCPAIRGVDVVLRNRVKDVLEEM